MLYFNTAFPTPGAMSFLKWKNMEKLSSKKNHHKNWILNENPSLELGIQKKEYANKYNGNDHYKSLQKYRHCVRNLIMRKVIIWEKTYPSLDYRTHHCPLCETLSHRWLTAPSHLSPKGTPASSQEAINNESSFSQVTFFMLNIQ